MIRLAVAVIFGVALWPILWPAAGLCFAAAGVVAFGLGRELCDRRERQEAKA